MVFNVELGELSSNNNIPLLEILLILKADVISMKQRERNKHILIYILYTYRFYLEIRSLQLMSNVERIKHSCL